MGRGRRFCVHYSARCSPSDVGPATPVSRTSCCVEDYRYMNRSEVVTRLWAAEAFELVPVCAWCGRLRVDREWLGIAPELLSSVDQRVTLAHSICPSCAENSGQRRKAVRRLPNRRNSRSSVDRARLVLFAADWPRN
jgi:hypothetical protein